MSVPQNNLFFDLRRLKRLGSGAIVGIAVRIRRPEETIIGDYAIIDDFTYISCPIEIGAYSHVAPNVTIMGGRAKVRIGEFCGIAAGCSIHAASSDYLSASFELPSIPEGHRSGGVAQDVEFADHVLIGAHSLVMPGVCLPEGFACTSHTAIRCRRYEPWTLYGGYDCKRFARREHRDVLERAAALKQSMAQRRL
jgi:acetyltransferase-like isoleucine patch superfamily enzyme